MKRLARQALSATRVRVFHDEIVFIHATELFVLGCLLHSSWWADLTHSEATGLGFPRVHAPRPPPTPYFQAHFYRSTSSLLHIDCNARQTVHQVVFFVLHDFARV